MRDAVDACLTQAFRDVAVPEGLAERLLAGSGGRAAAAAPLASLAVGRRRIGCRRGDDRCWPFGWAAQGGVRFGGIARSNEAIQSFDAGFEQPGVLAGQPACTRGVPVQSAGVVDSRNDVGEHVNDFLGRSGVVYDLPGPAGTRAALYVVACGDVEGLGTVAGDAAATSSRPPAGCCASAWQEGGLLYVLVVEGDPSTYGQYLNLPRSPVA